MFIPRWRIHTAPFQRTVRGPQFVNRLCRTTRRAFASARQRVSASKSDADADAEDERGRIRTVDGDGLIAGLEPEKNIVEEVQILEPDADSEAAARIPRAAADQAERVEAHIAVTH